MMRYKISTVIQIFLLMSVLQRVCRGIDCYQCISNEDKNCNDKSVDQRYLQACPGSYDFCRKSDSIYYFTGSRDYITIRECAMLKDEGKDCYHGRYSIDSYQRICECKDSGCNSSVNLIGGISILLIVSQLIVHYTVP